MKQIMLNHTLDQKRVASDMLGQGGRAHWSRAGGGLHGKHQRRTALRSSPSTTLLAQWMPSSVRTWAGVCLTAAATSAGS